MPFDSNSPTVVEGIDDEPTRERIMFFGRDLNNVPCFKESFLYGLVGSIGLSLLTFTATSRVSSATTTAVFSFTGIVLIYWFNCRLNYAKSKFTIAQTQRALQEMDRRMHNFEESNDSQTKD